MPHYRSLFLTLLIAAAPIAASAADGDFADLVDIGGGRKMYLECRGTGSRPSSLCRAAGPPPTNGRGPPAPFSRRRCRVYARLRLRPAGNAASDEPPEPQRPGADADHRGRLGRRPPCAGRRRKDRRRHS